MPEPARAATASLTLHSRFSKPSTAFRWSAPSRVHTHSPCMDGQLCTADLPQALAVSKSNAAERAEDRLEDIRPDWLPGLGAQPPYIAWSVVTSLCGPG